MFFETDRLAREALQEIAMATERVRCSQCDRVIVITADEDEDVHVECSCGHAMVVVIEKEAA